MFLDGLTMTGTCSNVRPPNAPIDVGYAYFPNLSTFYFYFPSRAGRSMRIEHDARMMRSCSHDFYITVVNSPFGFPAVARQTRGLPKKGRIKTIEEGRGRKKKRKKEKKRKKTGKRKKRRFLVEMF